MKRFRHVTALVLLLGLLLLSVPVSAGSETGVLMQLKTTAAALDKINDFGKIRFLEKNDIVLAFGEKSGQTMVEIGGHTYYVNTHDLKTVNRSANTVGLAQAKSNVTIYKDADENTGSLLSVDKGTLLSVLVVGSEWVGVRYGGKAGCVKRSLLDIYTASSPIKQYALVKKNTNLYAGAEKNTQKIASISAGEIVSVLKGENSKAAIVSNNRGKVGIISLSNSDLYALSAKPVGAMTAKEDATVYYGAGTSMMKLGTVKKGTQIDYLGTYNKYTVVWLNGGLGCIPTKQLKPAANQNKAGSTEKSASNLNEIRTDYVEIIKNTKAYAQPDDTSQSYGTVIRGATLRCYGSTSDNQWVLVQINGRNNKGYISRQYVQESNYAEDSSASVGVEDAKALIALTNTFRKASGLPELRIDQELMRAAEVRVKEITKLFDNVRPDGRAIDTLNAKITAEIKVAGISLQTPAGAAKILQSDLISTLIALSDKITKTGAACLKVDNNYYWVQLFG